MINNELARVFERIADLLEIDGVDRFRLNSYRNAGVRWQASRIHRSRRRV